MIVMKFGGTSVKDAAAFLRVAKIIERKKEQKPLIVLSAVAGITNLLEEMVHLAVAQKTEEVKGKLYLFEQRHLTIIEGLFKEQKQVNLLLEKLHKKVEKLRALLTATEAIRLGAGDLNHAILSSGELLSSFILSQLLALRGHNVAYADARDFMITKQVNGQNSPLPEKIKKQAEQHLSPLLKAEKLVVTQGFVAANEEGIPTTLGRNGSDFSASLIGTALQAQEIQIWTDVDGILTADPTIIPQAKLLETMTFDEASELAYFGARVLYPAAIQPALEQGIPVRVLNAHRPQSKGTLIINNAPVQKKLVKSIAYKEGITLLTFSASNMLLSTQVLSDFFALLNQNGLRVYAISKSATKISLTVENEEKLHTILDSLRHAGKVTIEPQKAIVSVVGENMRNNPDIALQVIQLLKENAISTDLISQFSSQISFMFIISETDINQTVKLLHNTFI